MGQRYSNKSTKELSKRKKTTTMANSAVRIGLGYKDRKLAKLISSGFDSKNVVSKVAA